MSGGSPIPFNTAGSIGTGISPINPAPSSTTPIASAAAQQQPTFTGETFQPTVRVMRLYKPGFHLTHTLPVMPVFPSTDSAHSLPSELQHTHGAEYTLSSHLILPDSFGDIYLGEKFSAFVAVVNGYAQVPFYSVSLSVRLQTTTTVIDLHDIRNVNGISTGSLTVSPIIACNESSDVIVSHVLNELGTHTLRVSVQYTLSPHSNEVKTLRKFYRFNVLQPLILLSSFREIGHKPMVQCQVTNATKSPIYIDEMSFASVNKEASFKLLKHHSDAENTTTRNKLNSFSSALDFDDILLLQPDESMSFSFLCTHYAGLVPRIIGYPLIKYNNSMGESCVYRGEDTVITSGYTPGSLVPQPIKFVLVSCPSHVRVGEEFEITIRLYNNTSSNWPLRLDCINNFVSATPNASVDESPVTSVEENELYFTGVTSRILGEIEAGSGMDFAISLFPACSGLYDIPIINAVHTMTKEKYSSGRLCKILVYDTEEEIGQEGELLVSSTA